MCVTIHATNNPPNNSIKINNKKHQQNNNDGTNVGLLPHTPSKSKDKLTWFHMQCLLVPPGTTAQPAVLRLSSTQPTPLSTNVALNTVSHLEDVAHPSQVCAAALPARPASHVHAPHLVR